MDTRKLSVADDNVIGRLSLSAEIEHSHSCYLPHPSFARVIAGNRHGY